MPAEWNCLHDMRILLTNRSLNDRGGTELVVLELSERLKRHGFRPVVYSSEIGAVAKELETRGVPVVTDLDNLQEKPDLIHGHHHLETMTACLHFPDVPAVYVCHGWLPWEEQPPTFPTIMTYIAVGEVTRERIVTSVKLGDKPVELIPTFFDDDAFSTKRTIRDSPRRAVIFDNAVSGDEMHVRSIRKACDRREIKLDIFGAASGRKVADPAALLKNRDLVFAVGRSALEAMATGCAVVVCNRSGMAGMAMPGDIDAQPNILSLPARSDKRMNPYAFVRQVKRYDPEKIAALREEVRASRSLSTVFPSYIRVYEETVRRFRDQTPPPLNVLLAEASKYIETLAPVLKGRISAPRSSG